ncbi:MAG: efflux RND transporter permease subunit [Verrucomicrobiae bacterium]|nr:efflux RND transporter permease subunit [Verrucomicrobiae bacterium]
MNLGVVSVQKDRVFYISMLLVLLGGVWAYHSIGRLEDPEFTIKEALIITPYPGASAEEVALEVSNPIENACQTLGQLKRVESESIRGRSIVRAVIRDQFDREAIPQVWDELRRKINDAQRQLPPSARGRSLVIDDFGDVYGIFLAITGEGYTQPELRRYAEFLRRELQVVTDVKKVDLFSEQQEVVFLEISRQRLAQLGINEEQIYAQLQAKNVVADGGRVRIGTGYPALDPTGGFASADEMLDLVIGSDRTGRQLLLRDVATIQRGYDEPPRRILKFDGQSGIGIGVSTVQGGNVVTMGDGVRRKLEELKGNQPIGIEIGQINFQPTDVTSAVNAFVLNLAMSVIIVVAVLLFAMGVRAGALIGGVLLLTILATVVVMNAKGILLERISLGSFIIALCMLTDNAIVVAEGLKVGIEAGRKKLDVVRNVVAQTQWPLFGATVIAVVAFAAIGLSDDSTGEYCNSLFWVIFLSLGLSWITAITYTPLLGHLLFKPDPAAASRDPYAGRMFQWYRGLLVLALRHRWVVIALSVGLFASSLWGFRFVKQSFFPPATRPQFMVDCFLPAGTHIRESERFADTVQQFIQTQPGVQHVSTFIGGGAMRFLLVYSPESENRAYVEFLVSVDDSRKIDGLIEKVQAYLDQEHPDANAVAKKFLLGPGAGGRIQARFSGPDSAVLRGLADRAVQVIRDSGNGVCVRHDWQERELAVRPEVLELSARRNGITRVEVAQALEAAFEGRTVGFYREPGGAATGVFPQETRLLPIVARPPLTERTDVNALRSLNIWSPVAGRMIPLSQVTADARLDWEDPIVMRRDRFPTITVHADPRTGLPSQLFARVRPEIEAIELPEGYTLEWGGEHEDSGDARGALAKRLPGALLIMVFTVVCLFNSVRITAVIWLTVPLCVIGVVAGLLITNQPFGFMALLGALSLSGGQIKNAIVLIDEYRLQLHTLRKPAYQAILDGSVGRLRPVALVLVTTVLGMFPLVPDPFFSAMAVAIIFGLAFAGVLTMIVVPCLYCIAFGINENSTEPLPLKDQEDSSAGGEAR